MDEMTKTNAALGTTDVLWNLGDLYGGEEDRRLASDITWCITEAAAIKDSYYGKTAKLDAAALLTLVKRLETLDSALCKLDTFSFLNFTTHMDNAPAGALHQRIHELVSKCGADTVFFQLEWNQLDLEHTRKLLQDPALAAYQHYLACLLRYRPHHLSEAEEKLLLEKEAVGRSSWTTLFDKVLSGQKFGAKKRSEEEVLSDLYAANRRTRRLAAKEFTAGLRDNNHILTHIFNTLAAEKMITDRLRRYSGWLDSMNLHNELQNSTVATLVETVVSRYPLVHRYYRVKQKLLGLKKLEHYDRYAPLPSLPQKQIIWNTCREIVLNAFSEFSPKMAEIGEKFFVRNWIHAPLGTGKRGGAFAHPCIPQVHP